MRVENHSAVGEEEVARRGVHKVDDVENVQVYVWRNRSVYKAIKKRKQSKPAKENNRTHTAVHCAIELEIRAKQFPVIIRDRLVH